MCCWIGKQRGSDELYCMLSGHHTGFIGRIIMLGLLGGHDIGRRRHELHELRPWHLRQQCGSQQLRGL